MRKLLVWIVIIASAFVLGIAAASGAGSLVRRVSAAPADRRGVLQNSSIQSQSADPQSGLTNTIQVSQPAQADPTPQPTPFVRPGTDWYDGCGWGSSNQPGTPNQGWNWGNMGPGMMGGWYSQGMGSYGSGMMGGYGSGMMGGWNRSGNIPASQRITLNQAIGFATQYITSYGTNLEVSEGMEFTQNFYVLIREMDTGRGAFELLVDPYTGTIHPEPGPNMIWNLKYGHMGGGTGDSTLTAKEARQLAQQALDANRPGAVIEGEGTSLYGYYTFDYKINNQIAGMLSVNGLTGDVWPHTWHGDFISEEEF